MTEAIVSFPQPGKPLIQTTGAFLVVSMMLAVAKAYRVKRMWILILSVSSRTSCDLERRFVI